MRTRRNEKGFTLLELMVVIIIFGVLAAIGLPTMSRWLPDKRMKAAARDITSAMAQAKAEAIRRGARVAVLFPGPVEDSGYKANATLYQIFVDSTPNGKQDAGEETVLTGPPLPNRVEAKKSGTRSELSWFNGNAVVFDNRGMPVAATGGSGAGQGYVRVCAQNSKNCRVIEVSAAGRITMQID